MPFNYYNRLSLKKKRVYEKSDSIVLPGLPQISRLSPLVSSIENSLKKEDREGVESLCQRLLVNLSDMIGAPSLRIKVLLVRPENSYGELHGIYYPRNGILQARIIVWMRTSRRKKVVAFRTFMRTLLHEFCHHLDYELYKLPYSFHTEGFYRRESDLLHQILGE